MDVPLLNNKKKGFPTMKQSKNLGSNLWTKKNLQRVLKSIRDLKNDSFIIESNPNEMLRYRITFKGRMILEALNGRYGYLVTYNKAVFLKTSRSTKNENI